MKSNLFKFHLGCKNELNELIKSFNILFYGFGCKRKLIEDIFLDTMVFIIKLQTIKEIVNDISLKLLCTDTFKTLKDVDNYLIKRQELLIITLINFDFSIYELIDLRNIRLIGTIENLNFTFTKNELDSYNFILRDLTTFINYTEEIIRSKVIL